MGRVERRRERWEDNDRLFGRSLLYWDISYRRERRMHEECAAMLINSHSSSKAVVGMMGSLGLCRGSQRPRRMKRRLSDFLLC